MRMLPVRLLYRRVIRLNSVVLPAPFWPSSTVKLPGWIAKLTPSSALRLPKLCDRPPTSRAGTFVVLPVARSAMGETRTSLAKPVALLRPIARLVDPAKRACDGAGWCRPAIGLCWRGKRAETSHERTRADRPVDPGRRFHPAGRGGARARCRRRRLDSSRRDGRPLRAQSDLRPRGGAGAQAALRQAFRRAPDDPALRAVSRGVRARRRRPD